MTKHTTDTPTHAAPVQDIPTPTASSPVNTPDAGTSGLAIASLVLGIVSFTGFGLLTGIPAIITGLMAIKKGQKERAMSLAGIIMGAITTLLSLLFIGFLILLFVIGAMNYDSFQQESAPEYEFPTESSRT